ncbi:LemA family protein [bacterium SCSIO 12741]|nr:LemA family protein [bacterium SCSIO 12741]
MNNKTWIVIGVVVGVLLLTIYLFYSLFGGTYNTLVEKDEAVKAQWSKVETQYQRRADLIPNLVNVVKGYADFEKEVLIEVTTARSKAGSVTIDPKNLTNESIQNYQKAQSGITSALSRLLVVAERYPDLKANQNFLELQAQLEGTENRIAVERGRFADAVQSYNTSIRQFPAVFIAGYYGFQERDTFHAQPGAEKAPEVKF